MIYANIGWIKLTIKESIIAGIKYLRPEVKKSISLRTLEIGLNLKGIWSTLCSNYATKVKQKINIFK